MFRQLGTYHFQIRFPVQPADRYSASLVISSAAGSRHQRPVWCRRSDHDGTDDRANGAGKVTGDRSGCRRRGGLFQTLYAVSSARGSRFISDLVRDDGKARRFAGPNVVEIATSAASPATGDDDPAYPGVIVTRIKRVPATVQKNLEPRAEVHGRGIAAMSPR